MSSVPSTAVKPSLAYAKIVATPTPSAWSQVYNAGSLFACLSLTIESEQTDVQLQTLGKEIFNNLETEFFSLEEKNLNSIKQALATSFSSLPSSVHANLVLAYFLDGILYLFLKGAGKTVMKRGDKIGTLLEEKYGEDQGLLSASGYLQHADCIVLQTKAFADDVTEEKLSSALELTLPNDIAETLSLDIHEKEDGGQAAVIVVYQGTSKITEPDEELGAVVAHEQEAQQFTSHDNEYESPTVTEKKRFALPNISIPHIALPLPNLSLKRKIYLLAAIVLIAVLIGGVLFTKSHQQQTKLEQQFNAVYPSVQKNIDDAEGLKTLNPGKSQDEFKQAEQTLKTALPNFPPGTKEHQQLADLLQKVEGELGIGSNATMITAKKATVDATDMLGFEKSATTNGVTQDGQTIYYVTPLNVVSVSKTDGKKKTLITNQKDWDNAKGIATYQGNMYILDSKNGIVKFVPSGSTFENSSYLKDTTPDFSQAVALAIDSSIYILFHDGTIQKYTRGQKDSFTISHLDRPLASPVKIFTDADASAIYVLDPVNSRVVKLGKDGTFQAQYASTQLKNAKDFEVSEKDKKILFLSDTVYEIPL